MGLSSEQVSKTSTIEGLDHHRWIGGGNSNNNNPVKQSSSAIVMKRNNSSQQNAAQSEPLKCPRCESASTKFCYYNNYNKSQPRHFCRACKRHWTKGGTLRNVPVGGARKSNKRPKKPKHDHHDTHNDDNDNKSVSEILYQAVMAPASFPGPVGPPPPPAGSGSGPGPGPFHHQGPAGTTMNGTTITPWQQLIMSNNDGSLDYCGWNFEEDIDSLVSADHIALPWEDSLSLDILKP